MPSEQLRAVSEKLVENCRVGKAKEGLSELYDPNAVSVEAAAMPGAPSAETQGLDAIRGKHDWWENTFEVHGVEIDGPYLHGEDRFSVIFDLDTTHKESGQRSQMKEVALYAINGAGKIVREEFFQKL